MLDHNYIDDHSLAERYLRHSLNTEDRRDFEAHIVDCQECADRILLAEMFLLRNGTVRGANPAPIIIEEPAFEQLVSEIEAPESPVAPVAIVPDPVESLPLRARVAARLTPWQIFFLFVTTALVLLSIPALGVYLLERLDR